MARRVTWVVVLALLLATAPPPDFTTPLRPGWPSLTWLRSWIGEAIAWGAPHTPPTPKQDGGTAAGKAHTVPAGATRSAGGAGHVPGVGRGQLPAYSPHQRPTTPYTTPAIPGFDGQKSKRIASAASATSDVYQNPDGSYTRKVYGGPVNYRAPDGSWAPIDTTVGAGSDNRLHEKANSLGVDFSGSAADATLAALRVDGGHAVSYSLQGAAAVPAAVSGSTVTYSGVLPHTDLTLTTVPTGLKEALVLHSADAPTSWVFPLTVQGLTPRLADGAVEFVDTAGAVTERIPPGYMNDAYVDAKSGNPHESRAVTYSLVTAGGGPALKVDVDGAWLRDPKRVFPVTVDPTFTASSSTFGENGQTQDNSGMTELRSGTYDSGADEARPFLKFDNFGSTYAGQRMTAVNLDLFDFWAWTCTPEPFSVSPVTSAWKATDILGWPGPSVGASIGSLTANPGAACTNTARNVNTGVWMAVPLSVGTFNSWTGGGTNNGLAVVASTTDNTQWKKFASVNTTHAPYLDITYTPDVPPQVDSQYPPDNYVATTLTPELLASGHDPDSYPNSSVQYSFVVYNSAGTQVASSGLISSGDYIVPSGTLAWSQNYSWTVQTYDGYSYSPSPVVNHFSTPVPQPLITSGLAQNAKDHGYDPSIGNYTTSATDARVDTVGPSLSVDRDYNSLDPRTTEAFGAGWSSVFDAKATERTDSSGTLTSVVVTYPNGQDVAYGRNANGSFTPPLGRFATFASVSGGGYTLTDKNDTVYKFTQPTGTSGVYGITSVTDAAGRAETFAYSGSQVTTVTSASGRVLHLTWSTPTGATTAHVATVVTDPATAGNASTALTWTYSYSGDQLSGVCPPTSSTACTTYSYTGMSQYPTAVIDAGPQSYWRLGEGSGSTAASSVLANEGIDNASYTNVTLGQPGPLPGSTATAASFNGTSSYVSLPVNLVSGSTYESISMWFKTSAATAGVLFSYQRDPITNASTPSNYVPSLYVGTDGKLLGEFWATGGLPPITTSGSVADGSWHHVVLTAAGNTSAMYLDGGLVGTRAGTIYTAGLLNDYIGTGFLGGNWPDEPHYNNGAANYTAYPTYFNGSISDVAFYTRPLTAPTVTALYSTGHSAAHALASVTRPSGQTYAQVSYDTVNGRVNQVTDENGATWKISAPKVTGSSQVYASSVMGSAPQDYWRLGEAAATQAVNQVKGGTATYNTVTLGAVGAFGAGDDTAASFNGTSSYVQLPGNVAPSGASSAELWFNTTHTGGILQAVQDTTMGTACTTCMPTLWVGSDGKLRGLAPSTTPTGKFGAPLLAGKCIDDNNGGTANGTKVQVWDCNGSAPQNWTVYPDGTVRNYGKCLDLSGYGTTNGTLVQLWDCTGATNQVWQPYNGGLRNPVSGRCLDDPSSSTTNGTQFQLFDCNASNAQQWTLSMASSSRVDDGKWHHAVLTTTGTGQVLYLDGSQVDSTTGTVTLNPGNQPYAYLGAGYTGTHWGGLPANTTAYFNGTIDDAASYRSALSGADVARHYAAYKSSSGVAPVSTVTVTDPGNKTITYAYDALNGNRPISQTDALGNKTVYGYDTSGFENTATDPNGVVTTTGHDVRGNVVSHVTCQNQAANSCSTVYYTYYPDDTSTTLTPDARNDLLLTTRDGRSASASDNTYLTSYSYDTAGNRTAVTTPPVAGFPSGRTSTAGYTDGTTVAAADGGYAPAGLPAKATTPGGAASTMTYFKNGDLAQVADAAGQVTKYSYDGLGRTLTKTVVSDSFPNGLVTSYSYDGLGQAVSETDPAITNRVTGAVHTPVTTTTYNPDGEVTSHTVADSTGGDASRTVSSTYNSYGQTATSTDANGKTTTFSYDTYGNKVKDVGPGGGETDFAYDAEGHLLTTTLVNYTGDPTNPSPAKNLVESSRAYDPAGRLASITDSMGWVTSYTYTDNGLPATITRADPAHGTSFVEESNTYDAAGNLTAKTTNNGATSTTYAVDAARRTTSSTLDPQGLARKTSYVFSPDDAVVTTTLSSQSATTQTSDATYDAMGRVTSRTVHNDSPGHPTGWWKLTDGARANSSYTPTAAVDSSGAGNTATQSGSGLTWSADAATFNGTSAALTTNGPVVNTAASFSVSAWVNLAATSSTAYEDALSQDGVNASGFELLYAGPANQWSFARPLSDVTNRSTAQVNSTTTATAGTWAHLVGVYDAAASTLNLYLNGVNQGSTAAGSTPWSANGPTVIGRSKYNGAGANYFNGSVSNVQLYDRALSSSDVSTLYTAGRTGSALKTTPLTTTWALDQRGLPTSMTDPNANTTGYAYDEAGRLAVTTAPTVNTEVNGGTPVATHPVSTVGYDTFGNQTETSDPNGNVTTTGYDAEGQVVSTTLPHYTPPGSTTAITATSKRTYDDLGRLATEADPLGHQTSYTYDQLGDVATETAPNNGVTHYTYDTNGHQLSITDATGAQTQETYDYLGNRITATQVERQPTSAAYTTKYAYSSAGGWLSSVTSPAGVVTSYGYDAAGETTAVTDGAHNTTTYQYDQAGHKVATILPDGTKNTVSYDLAGRPTATRSLDTSGATLATRSATYDANGNKLSNTDARGNTSTFSYDATGMISGEVQPVTATSSITTSFGYDAAGNRTRFTDGRGNPFLTTYNSWNLPESRIEPATPAYPNPADRTFTTSYDAAGRTASQSLPGGVSVANSYDNTGHLTGQTGSGAEAATTSRSFGYDSAGRLTSVSAGTTSDSFSYNDRGQLLSASGPSGSSSFGYTADGLMSSRADAAGTTSYTYDTAGRLWTLADAATGTQLSYAYNTLSQVSQIAYGSGGNVRSFGYDGLHRPTSDTLATTGGATVASIGYGYDANGNITSKNTTGFAGAASNTYTYDQANRLTSWNNGTTTVGYGYDASGNRTQVGARTYTYDARDELTSDGAQNYSYTARGTLSATTGTTPSTSTTDAFGQTITQGPQSYTYDGLGRALSATTSGGGTVSLSYTGAGNTLASDGSTTYSRDPGGTLTGIHTSTASVLAFTDQHTDVVGDFTATGASLSGSTTYDPLGNVTATANQAGSLGFQSEWTDRSTGRVNMLSRWYNPATGQFDNRDSANLDAVPNSVSANPFAYVDDNPMAGTDPTGMCSWYDVVCGVKSVAHTVASAASSTWNYVSSAASSAWDDAMTIGRQVYDTGAQIVQQVVTQTVHYYHQVTHRVYDGYRWASNQIKRTVHSVGARITRAVHHYRTAAVHLIKSTYHQAKAAVRSAYHRATATVSHAYHQAATAVKAGYHAAASAAKAGVQYMQHHAAAIASFVASTAVFMGCEAAISAVTAGAGAVPGAIACGALAGAVGNAVSYAASTAKSGKFSWSDMGKTAITGAAVGAAGGVLGAAGGKILSAVGGKLAGALGGVLRTGAEDATAEGASSAANEGASEAASAAESGPHGGSQAKEPTSCTLHSFAPDTTVLMADGSTKAIKDIHLDDKVKATDPKTGKTEAKAVVVLHDNHDTDMADVTVAAGTSTDGAGTQTVLYTTQHHPFWDATDNQWVDAANLKPGHRLRDIAGAAVAVVLSVVAFTAPHDMRDLTVADTHTYYVIAGTTPVLVHNCGGTVWDDIKGTQPEVAGTGGMPGSFELTAGETKVWVHGNATKHISEYAQNMAERGASPEMVGLGTQQNLRSLQAAVGEAGRGGLPIGELVTTGGWEMKFGAPLQEGFLPALIHARMVG
jgi:RHS repeat-associated protein